MSLNVINVCIMDNQLVIFVTKALFTTVSKSKTWYSSISPLERIPSNFAIELTVQKAGAVSQFFVNLCDPSFSRFVTIHWCLRQGC